MHSRFSKVALSAAALTASTLAIIASAPAMAASEPLSSPRIETHFDVTSGQLPENIAIARKGSVIVTLAASRQIARIDSDGATHILATLPKPDDGGVNTPVLGFPLTTGIVRVPDGTIYFLYATGTSDLTGVWELKPKGTPKRIAALPATGLPNGMALDPKSGVLYIADSVLGKVFSVRTSGGAVETFSDGSPLTSTGFLGANGVKIRHGAVWVTNMDRGTVLRIPIRAKGKAGKIETRATGLVGIDDFDFTGKGNTILAALNAPNTVELIKPNGTHRVVLNGSDGLQNPSAVAVHGGNVYVTNAAYSTQKDPNLLVAKLAR